MKTATELKNRLGRISTYNSMFGSGYATRGTPPRGKVCVSRRRGTRRLRVLSTRRYMILCKVKTVLFYVNPRIGDTHYC